MVCLAQQCVSIDIFALRIDGDAQARGDRQPHATELNRLRCSFQQALQNRGKKIDIGHLADDRHKLVSTDPRQGVIGAQYGLHILGDNRQKLIARDMAVGIID
ncbi:MAG: hypothetical protein BWZ07_02756 [Alphaproteobacteria bacterium ADurb.BinA280]|nr:MAG: hypothetical protein BWZ07_02756 [Alphaproteobacteria bacterium ADurb.BinA280]